MEELKIEDKVNQFIADKNIKHPFIKECILEFVKEHTEAFGKIVSVDELIGRLYENLDKITFAGKRGIVLGEYKGRIDDDVDQNEILIYADEADLELSKFDQKSWEIYTEKDKQELLQQLDMRRKQIKSTIKHELTHAAYTIKGEYGLGEKHVFSFIAKNSLLNQYGIISGKSTYVEPIINYISTKGEGKNVEEIGTYRFGTEAIYMLAEKMGDEGIIRAAWNSDELSFQEKYEAKIGKTYDDFEKQVGKLTRFGERISDLKQYNDRSKEILDVIKQVLEGKKIEKLTFKETEPVAKEVVFEGKNGNEDVSNSNIRKSLLEKATSFVKGFFKTKQGIKDIKEEKDGR